jgi:hypothetical protein
LTIIIKTVIINITKDKKENFMADEVKVVGGAFQEALQRNNSKIKADRATAIAEDTEILYKRTIEDLELSVKKMKREQENMLDLSPTDTTSLVLASDFNSTAYVEKDLKLSVKIRNTEIELDLAKKRFAYLFGGN